MAKRPRKITTETILKLRNRMLIHAQVKKDRQPEEVAQEYVLRLLEGLHSHATIGQAYIDIKRDQVNGRSKNRDSIMALEVGLTSGSAEALNYVEAESTLSVDDRMALQKAVGLIKDRRTRWIFSEVLKGRTQDEIAIDLNLTMARVSQIINRTIKAVRQKLAVRERNPLK